MNSILLGTVIEIPPPIKVGQVRMDVKGSVAIVTSEDSRGWLLEVREDRFQLVPREHQKSFEMTTILLGDL